MSVHAQKSFGSLWMQNLMLFHNSKSIGASFWYTSRISNISIKFVLPITRKSLEKNGRLFFLLSINWNFTFTIIFNLLHTDFSESLWVRRSIFGRENVPIFNFFFDIHVDDTNGVVCRVLQLSVVVELLLHPNLPVSKRRELILEMVMPPGWLVFSLCTLKRSAYCCAYCWA